jgi:hypothetical protein
VKLTKRRRKKTQINKIGDKIKLHIKTNPTEKPRIIRKHFKNLYSNKLDFLEEMDKFLDAYALPKLNQEDINHLNMCIYKTSNETEAVTKSLPAKKSPRWNGFTAEFYQTFKELTKLLS